MKRILLVVMTLLVVVGASAQPPRGPHGPRGFRPHPGPRAFKVVELNNDEVAAKFARSLRLDETTADAFAPVVVEFLNDRAAVREMFPVTRRPLRRAMMDEQPSEEQMAVMKVERAQMMAHRQADFELNKDFRPRFLEVLNNRQYHRMMRLLGDRGMYVKFERIADEEKVDETKNRAPEDIANGIQSIDNDKTETTGEWHAINGVTLKGQPTQSGIYVKDGKKVLVR